jgi:hypothetical protein
MEAGLPIVDTRLIRLVEVVTTEVAGTIVVERRFIAGAALRSIAEVSIVEAATVEVSIVVAVFAAAVGLEVADKQWTLRWRSVRSAVRLSAADREAA